MGNTGGVMSSLSDKNNDDVRENTPGEDALNSVLRRSIVEGIKLEFQRPTAIIVYGPPYSIVPEVVTFLSWKTNFPIIDPLAPDFRERVACQDCIGGYIIHQYPRTFEDAINLPSYEANMHHVAIFLTGSYEVSIFFTSQSQDLLCIKSCTENH
jgi:hypothetical protein